MAGNDDRVLVNLVQDRLAERDDSVQAAAINCTLIISTLLL